MRERMYFLTTHYSLLSIKTGDASVHREIIVNRRSVMQFTRSITRSILLLLLLVGMGGCVDDGGVIGEGGSLRSRFWLSGSKGGAEAAIFTAGERIYFNHLIINTGGLPLGWSLADIRPSVEFRITSGASQVRSSFDGLSFPQTPINGTMLPGDTLVEEWGQLVAGRDLPSGSYLARSVPTVAPGGIVVAQQSVAFEVRE